MTEEVEMTKETDVYAFSITCVEIVNLGKWPWGIMLEDEAIRQGVLKDNARPNLIPSPFNPPGLQFSQIVHDLELLQKNFGAGNETPKGTLPLLLEDSIPPSSPSPDMRPNPLPPMSPIDAPKGKSHPEETVATAEIKMPEPVMFTSNKSVDSQPRREDDDGEDFDLLDLDSDAASLAPMEERVLEMKNELRYRLLLNHPFHPSLILPLWQPSPVHMGAVGYLKKPDGEFITLFNALSPGKSSYSAVRDLPSIYGYGKAELRSQKQDKLNVLQKGLDSIVGWVPISRNKNDGTIPICRRYSYELRAGHKASHLCTESTEYVYMEKLTAARKWFQSNIDSIVRIFGKEHHIQREDIIL
ncbi:hypothetical protein EST38_g7248, partial [Candolleomyces aberdarensis]